VHKAQRLINHVALVLDASYSMKGRERPLTKVADEQIKHLAKRSEELSQETRVSVYYFGETTIECLIFDMDVMRLPSIADLYKVLYENTALIDATMKSQKDLGVTSQLYGDHAFLTFVLTDGQENRSKKFSRWDLQNHIMQSPVNWSMGFLVPDEQGVRDTEDLGVLRDSIAVWDTTSATGLNTAASAIRTATDNFMTSRAKGVRGTRSVFSTGIDAVNKQTVRQNLTPLSRNDYALYPVHYRERIDEFVRGLGMHYSTGMGYYQLTKTETIQPQKQIIVVDKATGAAFSGPQARHIIGLPDGEKVRVRPNHNPKYDIFVQSTSLNRILIPNTRLLINQRSLVGV
jgi:hypothetical protein